MCRKTLLLSSAITPSTWRWATDEHESINHSINQIYNLVLGASLFRPVHVPAVDLTLCRQLSVIRTTINQSLAWSMNRIRSSAVDKCKAVPLFWRIAATTSKRYSTHRASGRETDSNRLAPVGTVFMSPSFRSSASMAPIACNSDAAIDLGRTTRRRHGTTSKTASKLKGTRCQHGTQLNRFDWSLESCPRCTRARWDLFVGHSGRRRLLALHISAYVIAYARS